MRNRSSFTLAAILILLLVRCAVEEPPADDTPAGDPAEEIPALAGSSSPCVPDWTRAGDVDVRTILCDSSGGLRLIRVDPGRLDVVLTAPATAAVVGRQEQAAVVVNANFFDPEDRPLGIVRTRSGDRGARHNVAWQSIFSVDRDGKARIALAEEWDAISGDSAVAVQAGPRLVSGGELVKVNSGEGSARSGVCLQGTSVILFATAPGQRLTATETAELAHSSDPAGGMGCDEAMLFDGGGSTQLFVRDFGEFSDDADSVPVFLVMR